MGQLDNLPDEEEEEEDEEEEEEPPQAPEELDGYGEDSDKVSWIEFEVIVALKLSKR